jgi:hypothetical protein
MSAGPEAAARLQSDLQAAAEQAIAACGGDAREIVRGGGQTVLTCPVSVTKEVFQ